MSQPTTAPTKVAALGPDWRSRLTGWYAPLAIWLGWRLGLAAISFLALFLLPGVEHAGTAPPLALRTGSFYERFFGVWSHWDGEWFLHVAQAGYAPGEATSPFFPLYPLLVGLVALPLLGNYLVAGVLVNVVASLLVFGLLYRLVQAQDGSPVANRSVLYLAAFPTSFFLAACYSESVFLAATLGAFVAARVQRNWWLAGIAVALAALSRNIGILLLLPLGWEWLQQHRVSPLRLQVGRVRLQLAWRQLDWRGAALFVGLPVVAVLGWLVFQGVVLGDPFNFISVQSTPVWNRHRAWPWEPVFKTFELVGRSLGSGKTYREDPNLLDLGFWAVMTLGFGLTIYQIVRRRLPLSYGLYFAIALLLPLASPASKEPLLSFPRFALLGWPGFVALAQLAERRPWLHYLYLFGALMLLGVLAGRFVNWLWVA